MKVTNLNQQYLLGLVDMAINNYTEHVSPLPEFCNMSYGFEYGLIGGDITKDSVKITFDWLSDSKFICVDKDTDSYEMHGTNCSESITIVIGDKMPKLQSQIEFILDGIK